jgi:hypothetical protein
VTNAVDLVQSTIPYSVPGLSVIESDAVDINVRCIKYEMKKLQLDGKETVIFVVSEVVSPVARGAPFRSFRRPPSHSVTPPVPSSNACVAYSFCLLAQFS